MSPCLCCGYELDVDRRVYPLTLDGVLGFCCSFNCQIKTAREFGIISPPTRLPIDNGSQNDLGSLAGS